MPLFNRILVPTDLTSSSKMAFRHATKYAQRTEAELHLLHVMEDIEGVERAAVTPLRSIYDRLRDVVVEEMGLIIREIVGHAFTVQQHVTRGASAAPVILDFARNHDIDLIVLGTMGRQGKNRFNIGSTAERVVRSADCSVLSVGPDAGWLPGVARRVVTAVDFSDSSLTTLNWARILADFHQAPLDLLHVIEPIIQPVFDEEGANVFTFQGKRVEADALKEMKELYGKTRGPHVKVNYRVTRGRPARQIVRFAGENRSNLIVQGTRGLSGRTGAARLGTVAEKVVRTAPCPVFTGRALTVRKDEASKLSETEDHSRRSGT